jgi:hypothetical protein
MQPCCPGDRVSDGAQVGRVEYIIPGDRRGLGGGSPCEVRVLWDDGSYSFECAEDLLAEQPDDGE